MKTIDFYIEENTLISHLIEIKEKKEELEASISTMEEVGEVEVCTLFCPPDFYSISVNDQTVADIVFYEEQSADDRDILLRLGVILGKSNTCEMMDQGGGVGVASLLHSDLGALIVVGDFTLSEQWKSDRMIVVASPEQVKLALRKLYLAAKIPEDLFPLYCPHMFDNIYFHASPKEIRAMGLRYEDVVGEVIKHFSYLNDLAMLDFEACPQPHEIIQRAGSHGVEISPESPTTHRDHGAMEERKINIDGEILCCEWHTKIQPTQGRIHFYARCKRSKKMESITGTKVIVGIIANHLK